MLNFNRISHFSSQSSKNLPTNAENSCSVPSSSPSPFALPSNIPVTPSPLAAPDTISLAPPTPPTPLRAPPRPFASPIPPTYGQPHTPLLHVHSGPSMVHQCQPQQYQPYPAYMDSYMSASPYPNSPWPSDFPHYREIERQPHDPERRTYTPTEPRAHDPKKLQDQIYDEPTESLKKDHAEPDNVGETVS